jgi:hypothetical protein
MASDLLLLLLSSVIAVGCAEVAFRWYTDRTFDREFPPWTANLVVVRGAQVFAFKPNASGVFPGNVDMKRTFPYRTNADGLRDRDRPAKAPGTKRVLVVGDFYTWGYAVAEEEAYPQVAERLLAERGRPDIEVINGGIPDCNSRQERQLLEKLIPIYQPDAVFLAYVVNDAEPSTAMPTPRLSTRTATPANVFCPRPPDRGRRTRNASWPMRNHEVHGEHHSITSVGGLRGLRGPAFDVAHAAALARRGGAHSPEGELLHPGARAGNVDVPLRVGGDLMPGPNHARRVDRADDLERRAVDDGDFLAVADVEPLLIR